MLVDYDPAQIGRLLELSIKYRPTIMYNFGGTLMGATPAAAERAGIDPKDAFSSYLLRGVGGRTARPAARALAAEWELPLFEHTSVGDVTASFECSAHDGLHFWEDTALVEGIEPDATDHTDAIAAADGARCELVATALTNRVAPLIRYRSDDVVRLTRDRCGCGRTHAADVDGRAQERRGRRRRPAGDADRRVGSSRGCRRLRARPVPGRARRPARSIASG